MPRFDIYTDCFHRHYETICCDSGQPFALFLPAYQHGFRLALQPDYRAIDWETIEPQVRSLWVAEHGETWDQFKDIVRYAWETVKDDKVMA